MLFIWKLTSSRRQAYTGTASTAFPFFLMLVDLHLVALVDMVRASWSVRKTRQFCSESLRTASLDHCVYCWGIST